MLASEIGTQCELILAAVGRTPRCDAIFASAPTIAGEPVTFAPFEPTRGAGASQEDCTELPAPGYLKREIKKIRTAATSKGARTIGQVSGICDCGGQFPNDLVGVGTCVEVTAIDGINCKGPQQRSPFRVQLGDTVADYSTLCIVQLENCGSDRASAA
jgi:hypothetical protein